MGYCAKMAVDVPLSAYEHRHGRSAQLMMVAHNLMTWVAIGCGLATKRCAFFACMALCAEASTPFLNNITACKLFGGQRGADSLIHFLRYYALDRLRTFSDGQLSGVVVGV